MRSILLFVAVFVWVGISPAGAGELFRWEAGNGTLSFSNDIKRIPERYRESAEKVVIGPFEEYGLFTKSLPSVTSSRLEHLRKINQQKPVVTDRDIFRAPFRITREMRWVSGVLGAPGDRWGAVDVLYDADGREIATALSDIGFEGIELRVETTQ